jgi:hypothetical protein
MSDETPTPERETEESHVGVDEALESTVRPTEPVDDQRPLALDAEGANQLAAARRPTVLVLAGDVGSGKTSIYAALYERFGRGPFGGRRFAGSLTIPGFEKRCHGWRLTSGASAPTMSHTQPSDLQWLHMRIRDEEGENPVQDVLFGDYDGEIFKGLARGEEPSVDMSFLRRADHVGIGLDGDHLSDHSQREAALENARYLAAALLDEERIADPSVLFLVLTKLDLVETRGDEHRAAIESAIHEIAESVKERSGHEPPILRLAARSASDRFPLGHGLNELLDLLTERPAVHIRNDPRSLENGDPYTEFRA